MFIECRNIPRETKHPIQKKRDQKSIEKVLFQEKQFAQDIHSQLLINASQTKISHMIRLDNAFQDDWKSILRSRYTINKTKRKSFLQTLARLQNVYEDIELIFQVTIPSIQFPFPSVLT